MMMFIKAATALLLAAPAAHGAVAFDEKYELHRKNGLTWTSNTLRMNHIQVLGTHNSYHVEAPDEERMVQQNITDEAHDLVYSHAKLDTQLKFQNIRSIELDLFADPDGGNYADPLINKFLNNLPPTDPVYRNSGVKVMHIPDLDIHTTCPTLVTCLHIIKNWMNYHPGAVPLTVLMEFKTADKRGEAMGGAKVISWRNETLLADMDDEIRSVFPSHRLITPDDVRRDGLTLENSVITYGWPDLESARGRIMFLMDNGPESPIRDAYLKNATNLQGRVLFTNSLPREPDCAFQKLNNLTTHEASDHARRQVLAGYWVRARADEPLRTIRDRCSLAQRAYALSSGAQIVSTDFPMYGMSARWGCDYAVKLPRGAAARCNPVFGRDDCRSEELEAGMWDES